MIDQIKYLKSTYGDEIALIDANRDNRITWKRLYEEALYIAVYLKQLITTPQSPVAIIMENCIEWFIIYFGTVMADFTAVVINPHNTIEDISFKLDSLKCACAFFDNDLKNIYENNIKSFDNKIKLFSIDDYKRLQDRKDTSSYFNENLLSNIPVLPNKSRCIYFSSGTTGKSRAITLSLDSLNAIGKTELRHHQQTSVDVFLCAAPLYHVGAFAHWLGSLFSGSKAVLYRIETPQKLLYIIEKYNVTIAWLLLPWVQDIFEAIDVGDIKLDNYNLDSWRLMHMGAQPIPEIVVRRWGELFPNQQFDINYGLTESGGPGCIHLGLGTAYKPQMLGVVDEEWELGIRNLEKVLKIKNLVGELCVKGPGVMECYYNDLQATRQVLSDDGWLFTGDMGYIDEEGYVFYTGRKKELIIVGGENIYPLEIENHIKKIPRVKDVAVIGIPNNRLGEVAIAIVELSDENTEEIARKEIRQHCRSLPVYKRPTKFFFDAIPRSSTGKINKKQLYSKYVSNGSGEIYE